MSEVSQGRTEALLYALGYANVDVIANVARLPGDGDRVTASGIEVHPGGMAANCACAAAQLGTSTQLLAAVGRGGLAQVLLDDLAARGVGTDHLHRGETTTLAVITVTPDGQRSIISEPVAYQAATVDAAIDSAAAARKLLYVDGYHLGRAEAQLARAKAAGFRVYCDLDGAPDTYAPDEVEASLRSVDVAQWNPAVAQAWLPGRSEDARRAWLVAQVPTVVTTRGADPIEIATAEGTEDVLPPPVDAVLDTTGAGDIFAGATLFGLSRGETVTTAVRRASRVAADSVRYSGARLPAHYLAPD